MCNNYCLLIIQANACRERSAWWLPSRSPRPPFAYPRLPKTSDRKKDVSFAGYNGTVMSFNFVICPQFAFLIKKNVDWVIFTVFFLIKMYSTVFQNKQHNCAWRDGHVIAWCHIHLHNMRLFSNSPEAGDAQTFSRSPALVMNVEWKKFGFMEGHLYW